MDHSAAFVGAPVRLHLAKSTCICVRMCVCVHLTDTRIIIYRNFFARAPLIAIRERRHKRSTSNNIIGSGDEDGVDKLGGNNK